MYKLKVGCVIGFFIFALLLFLSSSETVPVAGAYSSGPPPGYTNAPGEMLCSECHQQHTGPGQFTITAPELYTPGQTYQITVRHMTSDRTRMRWGFQVTALANFTPAGTFTATAGTQQVIQGDGGRTYIEHTRTGTFAGQTTGAEWTFDWTAPAEDLGQVTFYAAG